MVSLGTILMAHTISDERWRKVGTRRAQFPIAYDAGPNGSPIISLDSRDWIDYPPFGWVRETPTPWNPASGDPDPDPPDAP